MADRLSVLHQQIGDAQGSQKSDFKRIGDELQRKVDRAELATVSDDLQRQVSNKADRHDVNDHLSAAHQQLSELQQRLAQLDAQVAMKADIMNVNDLFESHTNDVNDVLGTKASLDDLAAVQSGKCDTQLVHQVQQDMFTRLDNIDTTMNRTIRDLRQDVTQKADWNRVSDELHRKVDRVELGEISNELQRHISSTRGELSALIDVKVSANDFKSDISHKADRQEVSDRLSVLHQQLNELQQHMMQSDDLMALKADIACVNDLLETHTNDVNDALNTKASQDELSAVRATKVDVDILQTELSKMQQDSLTRFEGVDVILNRSLRDIRQEVAQCREHLTQKADLKRVTDELQRKVDRPELGELSDELQRHISNTRGELAALIDSKVSIADVKLEFSHKADRKEVADRLMTIHSQLLQKVEQHDFQNALQRLATNSDLQAALAKLDSAKVDKTEFGAQLHTKANAADVTQRLAAKANMHDIRSWMESSFRELESVVQTKADLNLLRQLSEEVRTKATLDDVQTVIRTKLDMRQFQTAQSEWQDGFRALQKGVREMLTSKSGTH
eukprot:TRINITY_DN701_c0_g1_i1.p1 TRINITY_DN701_c0_g1~~TRINITY_DN701_c0_g1_i1.p1  ORF type:complete len:644 (-),score=165.14 TRINITY_DN701_c0_g1_i1:66-1748(-)